MTRAAALLRPEVLSFLAVGAAGYVVDVVAFNWFRSSVDPTLAKVLAVAAAMVVTYLGNRLITWRDRTSTGPHEIALFVLFNIIGLGISVGMLLLTHNLLGMTSRLADNISANVIGLGLGTAFRYWSYRRFVFVDADADADTDGPGTSRGPADLPLGPLGEHSLHAR
jgi:putative flippase GtrA